MIPFLPFLYCWVPTQYTFEARGHCLSCKDFPPRPSKVLPLRVVRTVRGSIAATFANDCARSRLENQTRYLVAAVYRAIHIKPLSLLIDYADVIERLAFLSDFGPTSRWFCGSLPIEICADSSVVQAYAIITAANQCNL